MSKDPYANLPNAAEAWVNAPKKQYEQPKTKDKQIKVSVMFNETVYMKIMQEVLPKEMGSKFNKNGTTLKYTISDYLRELVDTDLKKRQNIEKH